MLAPLLPRLVSPRLPFFYGWVILGCLCCAGIARQGSAVATLSVFLTPMTQDFGWSRMALSGAVSVGGVLAAISSLLIGSAVDRHGARVILSIAVLATGIAALLLSQIGSLAGFYLFFCVGRLNWGGPFELGIYGALNNWFVARRAFATAIASLAQMLGLVAMPLIAQHAMLEGGWRAGWVAVGTTVLAIGFLPVWLLLVRRPEDLGLFPDRRGGGQAAPIVEASFTRREAVRSAAFWLLLAYTMLIFAVQAGVSLHQASHLIERGIAPVQAAAIIGTFSAFSALSSIGCGFLPRSLPVRYPMALASLLMAAGVIAMVWIATPTQGFLAASSFGFGLGGVLTLVPLAWADYFGRANFGAVRSVALPWQVLAQAAGPLLSGALRDSSGDYVLSLQCFAGLSLLSVAVALAARTPQPPPLTAP